mmetsp:Transcript_4338/g.10142  ORF Transcript_4338/g.10142 Transcript_4338/m.10142 type:complete len:132 (-) Transcript_4338:92-487(-)
MRHFLFLVVIPTGAILSSPVSFVQLALLADDVPDDDIENRVLVQSPEERHRRALIEVAATAPEVEEIPTSAPEPQKPTRTDTATLLSAAALAHTEDPAPAPAEDDNKKPLLSGTSSYRFGIGEKLVTMWAR